MVEGMRWVYVYVCVESCSDCMRGMDWMVEGGMYL